MNRRLPAIAIACLAAASAAVLVACRASAPLPAAAAPPPARDVVLRLAASPRLNSDARGRPLALVVRVYLLRQRAAFDAAPYAAFLSPEAERAALGDDLVAARDVTLVPGQRMELTEKPGRDAAYVGVAALFHAPAPGGWRLSLATLDAPPEGIDLLLGACAIRRAGAPAVLARCQ